MFHEKKKFWYYSYEVKDKCFLEIIEEIIKKIGKYEYQIRTFAKECHLDTEHVGIKWFQITINEKQIVIDGIRNDNVRFSCLDRMRGIREKVDE